MPSYPDAINIGVNVLRSNVPNAAVGTDDLTYNVIAAVAAIVDKGYSELNSTVAQMSPTSATGGFLDDLANEVDVYRDPDVPATGTVVITLTPGPVTDQPIPARTIVSTAGNPAVYFATQAAGLIPAGGSSSSTAAVPVMEVNHLGSGGNVGAGTVQIVNYQLSPGTLTVTNASPTAGGSDEESDDDLRARVLAATKVKYGAEDLAAEVLTVDDVWDVWVNDPSAPPLTDDNPSGSSTSTGLYNYYWCAADGTQPGAGGTPTGVALAVLNALTSVQPPGVIPTSVAFTVVSVTAVAISYRVPSGVSAGQVEPVIQQAIVDYVQSLRHNQVPDAFNMGQFVQARTGNALLLFSLTSMTPSVGSPSHSTIYRCTGSPASVVTCTAV